jgi:hypothetical protein
MNAPNLADMPQMDDHKIGPGGETFGQLKQRVRDCRLAYVGCSNDSPVLHEYAEELASAVRVLRAAYIRVGLPYVSP